jgi:hypothetical protein
MVFVSELQRPIKGDSCCWSQTGCPEGKVKALLVVVMSENSPADINALLLIFSLTVVRIDG